MKILGIISGSGSFQGQFGDQFGVGDHFGVGIISGAVQIANSGRSTGAKKGGVGKEDIARPFA